jgi:ribosome production factor 1
LARNVPHTIDKKRVWDDVDGDGLNVSVDVEQLKKRRIEEAEAALEEPLEGEESPEDDVDSMLDSDSEEEEDSENPKTSRQRPRAASNAPSLAPSTTSTNLDLTPTSLALKFPTLFSDEPPPVPKVLVRFISMSHSRFFKSPGAYLLLVPGYENDSWSYSRL